MKRRGQLIGLIADMDNLREAFMKAKTGKGANREVQRFLRPSLDANLSKLRDEILEGEVTSASYLQHMMPLQLYTLHHLCLTILFTDDCRM